MNTRVRDDSTPDWSSLAPSVPALAMGCRR